MVISVYVSSPVLNYSKAKVWVFFTSHQPDSCALNTVVGCWMGRQMYGCCCRLVPQGAGSEMQVKM